MKNQILSNFEKRAYSKIKAVAKFRTGDRVRVHYKVAEGADKNKFRIQPYEGIVTRNRRGTAEGSFTVRKISAGGIGVERVFPRFSTFIDKVEVLASGRVRRSRLYYLRDRSGKSARIRSKFFGGQEEAGARETAKMQESTVDEVKPIVSEAPATEAASKTDGSDKSE